jgi:hypothetical protein
MIWYLFWALLWMTVGHLIGAVIYTILVLCHITARSFDWDDYHECWEEILDSKYIDFDWTKFSSWAKWSAWALIWPIKLVDMWIHVIPSADRLYRERFGEERP